MTSPERDAPRETISQTYQYASSTQRPESQRVVVDAIGGTSVEAHRAGLERVVQAGARPISWVALAVELQRD